MSWMGCMGIAGRQREHAICFFDDMTLPQSIRQIVSVVMHVLPRIAAIFIGFILMVLGLGMSTTLVMLPVGVLLALLGFALIVGGLFVHIDRPEQTGER
jgi:Na+/H+-dicarboxylate symporter